MSWNDKEEIVLMYLHFVVCLVITHPIKQPFFPGYQLASYQAAFP